MTMPAGRYYVGDLCYVMDSDEWVEFCGITMPGNEMLEGEFTFKDGRRFAQYSTKYGDGGYSSNIGAEFSVDAGLIGVILATDIRANKYDDVEKLGAFVDFAEPFESTGGRFSDYDNWDGTIQFGPVKIYTAGDLDQDDNL